MQKYYSRQTWERALHGLEVCLNNVATEKQIQVEANSEKELIDIIDDIGQSLTEIKFAMEELLKVF